MQQVQINGIRSSTFATSPPELIVALFQPGYFFPPRIIAPVVAGTSYHATLIVICNYLGGTTSSNLNVACFILQYAEDLTPQLIRRGLAPITRAAFTINQAVATYWSGGDETFTHVPVTFNSMWLMLDFLYHTNGAATSQLDNELGATTCTSCEKLKRMVLSGRYRLFYITGTSINVEGKRTFYARFLANSFWTWYEKLIDEAEYLNLM